MPNKTWDMGVDMLPTSTETFNLGNASKKWLVNGYTLGDACAKGVDTTIASNTTSTNVPTSSAVSTLFRTLINSITVEGKTLVIDVSALDIYVSGETLIINN